MTASDIARFATDLVAAERKSRELWDRFENSEQVAIYLLVRRALLRLLADPHWVPTSIRNQYQTLPQRLDVTFSVPMDDLHDIMLKDFSRQVAEMKDGLLEMARHLSED